MKIVGMMVVGKGEADRWLKQSLDQFYSLADTAVIVLCNADDKTKNMVAKSGFDYYEDNREWGKDQPRIKTDLLKYIGQKYNPDWVLAKDSDEIYDTTREDIESLILRGGIAWYFYVVNLWNDENHYAKGMSFWNIRLFKYEPKYGLQFINKSVHCGLAPPVAYEYGNYAPHILWHYGLMNKEDRLSKVERYRKYDPNAKFKSSLYYEQLASNQKPPLLNVVKLRKRVIEDVERIKNMKGEPIQSNEPEGYIYMRHEETQRTIDVPAKDEKRYVRQGFVKVADIDLQNKQVKEHEDVTTDKSEDNSCVICGKEYKTSKGLEAHKKKAH